MGHRSAKIKKKLRKICNAFAKDCMHANILGTVSLLNVM